MDNAVALVRAYLHVNGYFTVTEYPVLEAARHGGYRTVTDLDVLAVRFPGAGRRVLGRGGRHRFETDPALRAPTDRPDMLVAEVKEGRGRFNEATLDAGVIEAALARFGCAAPDEAASAAHDLLRRGAAQLTAGHQVRLAVFSSDGAPSHPATLTLSLGHMVEFVQDHLRAHWDVLHHAQSRDPAMGFLMLLEKATRMRPAPPSSSSSLASHDS